MQKPSDSGDKHSCIEDVVATPEGYVCTDAFVRRIAAALAGDQKKLAAFNDPNGGAVVIGLQKLRVKNADGNVITVSGITRMRIVNLIFEHTVTAVEGAVLPSLPPKTTRSFEDEPLQTDAIATPQPAAPTARTSTNNDMLRTLYAQLTKPAEEKKPEEQGGGSTFDFGKVMRGLQSTSPAVRQMHVAHFPIMAKMRVAQMSEREVKGEGGEEVVKGFSIAENTKEFVHAFKPEEKRDFLEQKRYVMRDLDTRRGTRTEAYGLQPDAATASRRAKLGG